MPSLPFLSEGALFEQGGAAVAAADEIPCSVWPATNAYNSQAGRHHTHRGEAHLDYAAELKVPNRTLTVDGESYRVIAATAMPLIPHVVLELLMTSGRS